MRNKILPISEVFSQLYLRYKKIGLEIYGSYSYYLKTKPSNYVLKNKKLLCTSGGLANDELFITYSILSKLKPKNILIIGNGYGISTVFTSLTLLNAKVVTIEKYRTKGIEITKKVLNGIKNKIFVRGSTPEDLEKIIKENFDNKLDLVIVDAVHTNEVQTKEFLIYQKYLSNNSVVFFHDIISCNLFNSYNFLKKKYKNYYFNILNKSSNGLGVCCKLKSYKKIEKFLKYFSTEAKRTSNFIKFINSSKKNKKGGFYTPKHPQL